MKLHDLDDLVDASDVAEICGLSHRNTVSQYQRRYSDMPRPLVSLGDGRPSLWSRKAIENWDYKRKLLEHAIKIADWSDRDLARSVLRQYPAQRIHELHVVEQLFNRARRI